MPANANFKSMKAVLACLYVVVRIMFWNVENYFRPRSEQAPPSWTYSRFERKSHAIAKTIIALDAPSLIGLCEVQDAYVLHYLCEATLLHFLDYGIVHRDSPDPRGIDVALLYRKQDFAPVDCAFIPVRLPTHNSRDILYVKGVLHGRDTLHLFVNHWPSKRGGPAASRQKRQTAATVLARAVDSLQRADREAKIILMGDFNDGPQSEVIESLLQGRPLTNMVPVGKQKTTYKFAGAWERIDQFMVSGSLTARSRMEVAAPAFLLERDEAYTGNKPKRNYAGPRYLGGISDHLIILLTLFLL